MLATALIAMALIACQDTPDVPSDGEGAMLATEGPEVRPTREFEVRYEAYVKGAPTDKQIQIWIPVPRDDPAQTISNLEVTGVDGGLSQRWTEDATFGNKLLYLAGTPTRSDFTIQVTYRVKRFEYRTDQRMAGTDGPGGDTDEIFLRASKLVVINDQIRQMATDLGKGKTSDLDKARAFYNFVSSQMTYGKPSDKPWGRGDTMYACDARIGNCTDFHSYFISLCRASGIPARFQIGLFGAYDKKVGEEYKTGGYHCWAEFYVSGHGWVPVDISEADKRVDKGTAQAEVYFGYHTDNRVTLTTGRDLTLEPRQAGPPLNYLVHPYAEVDGKPFKLPKQGFWRDLE